MKKVLICTILFFLTLLSAQKKVSFVADVWEPYNNSHEAIQKGYVIDILQKIYEKAGYQVEYSIVPWTRALAAVEQGAEDGAIGSLQTAEREKKFFFPAEECGVTYNEFYVKNNSSWQYKDIASLSKLNIGIIGGYLYAELDDYINANRNNANRITTTFGENALEQNIRLLAAGRLDGILVNEKNIQISLKKLKMENQFKSAGMAGKPQKMFVVFSKQTNNGKELAELFSKGISDLRKSGELKKILAGYNLKDWK